MVPLSLTRTYRPCALGAHVGILLNMYRSDAHGRLTLTSLHVPDVFLVDAPTLFLTMKSMYTLLIRCRRRLPHGVRDMACFAKFRWDSVMD
jgi:hypothetical protein